jgi:hypothetical protein
MLVITLGDSWVWGGCLDTNLRLQQVHGKLLADHYSADWINLGCQGRSNSWILAHLEYVINLLKDAKYKKILVSVTLTENSRDIGTPETCKYDYVKKFQELGNTEDFFNQVLVDFENQWIDQLQKAIALSDDRYVFFVGQNFAWHQRLYNSFQNTSVCLSDLNWIEVWADYQQLARPVRTSVVSAWTWTFNLEKINEIVNNTDTSVYKAWVLPWLEKANLVNQWLEASALNKNKQSKHPTALGQQVWANYIINQLKEKLQ